MWCYHFVCLFQMCHKHTNQFAIVKYLNTAPLHSVLFLWQLVRLKANSLSLRKYYFPTTCISAALSLELNSWARKLNPDLIETQYFLPKPTLDENMAKITLNINFLSVQYHFWQTEIIMWEFSLRLTKSSDPAESLWICEPSSATPFITFPTPHWISSLLPELLSPLQVCVWPRYWVRLNWSVVPL